MRRNILKVGVIGLMFAFILATMTLGAAQASKNESKHGEKVRITGTVTAIDLQGQNFSVADRSNNAVKIFVNPTTEFEIEKGKGFWGDSDVPFKDLVVGDWVKVKSYRVSGELEADDVEIYRDK